MFLTEPMRYLFAYFSVDASERESSDSMRPRDYSFAPYSTSVSFFVVYAEALLKMG